jgi:L-lactate dehydrogenase complex protein LldG
VVEDPVVNPTSKETILARIRGALGDVPRSEQPENVAIPRDYRRAESVDRASLIAQFVERVSEYKAAVRTVSAGALAKAIAQSCAERGIQRLVVPAGLPEGWIPETVTRLKDPGLTVDQIETSDGVLTACALGIAQTGTIVLDCGPGQGRRILTLLPDYHLCVIRDDQVVGLVPEAIARLHDVATRLGRPITFISGPSATSDIELSRVEGVHGPRSLEVLVVAT